MRVVGDERQTGSPLRCLSGSDLLLSCRLAQFSVSWTIEYGYLHQFASKPGSN